MGQTGYAGETPGIDIQLLTSHIIGKDRTWVLAHPEYQLSHSQSAQLSALFNRLNAGEPLPYIIGRREFFGLDFIVSPAVLIPRPETELLVEEAQSWLRRHPEKRSAADVGTGSGCIAVSLAKTTANLNVVASDISYAALRIAKQNIEHHKLTKQVFALNCHLLDPLSAKFDLVCANLPYIPTSKLQNLRVLEHEPGIALDGGNQGVSVIQKLINKIPHNIASVSLILLEIEATLGEQVVSIIMNAFPAANVRLLHDLAGLPRVVRVETYGS